MNSLLTSNVALLTFAAATMASAVDLAIKSNYISAGFLVVISVLAFLGYEKLPPSTPPAPPVTP